MLDGAVIPFGNTDNRRGAIWAMMVHCKLKLNRARMP